MSQSQINEAENEILDTSTRLEEEEYYHLDNRRTTGVVGIVTNPDIDKEAEESTKRRQRRHGFFMQQREEDSQAVIGEHDDDNYNDHTDRIGADEGGGGANLHKNEVDVPKQDTSVQVDSVLIPETLAISLSPSPSYDTLALPSKLLETETRIVDRSQVEYNDQSHINDHAIQEGIMKLDDMKMPVSLNAHPNGSPSSISSYSSLSQFDNYDAADREPISTLQSEGIANASIIQAQADDGLDSLRCMAAVIMIDNYKSGNMKGAGTATLGEMDYDRKLSVDKESTPQLRVQQLLKLPPTTMSEPKPVNYKEATDYSSHEPLATVIGGDSTNLTLVSSSIALEKCHGEAQSNGFYDSSHKNNNNLSSATVITTHQAQSHTYDALSRDPDSAAILSTLASVSEPEGSEDQGLHTCSVPSESYSVPLVVINRDPYSRSSSSSSHRISKSPNAIGVTQNSIQRYIYKRSQRLRVPPASSSSHSHSYSNGEVTSNMQETWTTSDNITSSDGHFSYPSRRVEDERTSTLQRRNTRRPHEHQDGNRVPMRTPYHARPKTKAGSQPITLPSPSYSSNYSHNNNNGNTLQRAVPPPRRAPSHRLTVSAPASSQLLAYPQQSLSSSSHNFSSQSPYGGSSRNEAPLYTQSQFTSRRFDDDHFARNVHERNRRNCDESPLVMSSPRDERGRGRSAPSPSRHRFWRHFGYLARIVVKRLKHWATISSAGA